MITNGIKEKQVNKELVLKGIARINLESSIYEDVIVSFRKTLPSIIDYISGTLKALPEEIYTPKDKITLMKENNEFIRRNLNSVNFLLHKDKLISVLEGMKGNMHDFLKLIRTINEEANPLYLEFINEFNTALSIFVSNKTDTITLSSVDKVIKKISMFDTVYIPKISEFMTKTSVSKRRLGDVMSSFKEIDLIEHEYLKLLDINRGFKLEKIKTEVAKSDKLLSMIVEKINEQSASAVSPEVAKRLSECALGIARMLEFISMTQFITMVLEKTVEDLINEVSKIFNLRTYEFNF